MQLQHTPTPHRYYYTMNHSSVIPVAVLLAAPVCMVAQAEPTTVLREYAIESITALNELAAILEKVTSATVDDAVKALDAMKPKLDSLKASENKFSAEEKKELANDKELSTKMMDALTRLMSAADKLEQTAQDCTTEQQQQLIKVAEKLQALLN